jgi:pimeloyl-ACP methyl ester carboxylesterase
MMSVTGTPSPPPRTAAGGRRQLSGTRPRQLWVLTLAAVVFAGVAPIGFAGWVGHSPPDWLPTPLVTFAFDVRLVTAPTAKKLISVSRGSLLDKRVHLAGVGEEVRFPSGSVQLTGGIYRGYSYAAPLPGILLIHGSTPEGRRMGIYRVLAEALAERGYMVLAIDQRGFGRSRAAPDPRSPDAFDFVGDALRALAYLAVVPGVDSTQLNVIGHSFGVGAALTAGLLEPRNRGIVIMGPGAPDPGWRAAEETEAPVQAEEEPGSHSAARHYMARRALRYGSISLQPGVDYVGQPMSLDQHGVGALAAPDHKPLLIVTDAFEPEETLAALRTWQQGLRGQSRLLIVPDADHYLNTAGWGALVVYDARAVSGIVDEIDRWLRGSPGGCAAMGTCARSGWPLIWVLALVLAGFIVMLILAVRLRRGRITAALGEQSAAGKGGVSRRGSGGGDPGANIRTVEARVHR